MASVIGILFFIVFIMALNLTQAAPSAAPSPSAVNEFDLLENQCQSLRDTLSLEQEKLITMMQHVNRAGEGQDHLKTTLSESRDSLKILMDQIARDIKRFEKLSLDNYQMQARLQALQNQLQGLQQYRETLLGGIDEIQNKPPIAFILDELCTQMPILVELTEHRLVVSDLGINNITVFAGEALETRIARFMAWAGQRDKSRYYFVLFVKPSGVFYADDIQHAMKDQGFTIGLDLIPETRNLFEIAP